MSTPFTHTSTDGRTYTGRRNSVEPTAGTPLVIALHGGTYTSEYFDIPGYSLLDRGEAAGIPVIALDRPNYAGSSPLESDGSIIMANAEVLEHRDRRDLGAARRRGIRRRARRPLDRRRRRDGDRRVAAVVAAAGPRDLG